MIIFNTTYLVSDKMYDKWLKWLREEHIPAMLETGRFTRPQVAKVLSADPEQEGTSFTVQFHTESIGGLNGWYSTCGEAFLDDFTRRFGREVLLFSSVLEVMEA